MALKHILGTVPVIKILDYLLDHDGSDYTKDEIQEYAGVRPVDMRNDFHCLIDCGVLVKTRKIRGAQLYRMDMENKLTQALLIFDEAITDYGLDTLIDDVDVNNMEETEE